MNALEQVNQLKQQGIGLLLNEREQIDQELSKLGYGQEEAPLKIKRGRKPKITQPEVEVPQPLSFRSDMKAPVAL